MAPKQLILLVTNEDSTRYTPEHTHRESKADIIINIDTGRVLKHCTLDARDVVVIRMPQEVPEPHRLAEFKQLVTALDHLAAATLKWKHSLGMDEGEGNIRRASCGIHHRGPCNVACCS